MVRRDDAIFGDVGLREGEGQDGAVAKVRGERGVRRVGEEGGEVGDVGS